ncbi:MAG: hypothetical protein GX576_12195 [Thauera phenolivorans]|mgnify:CR=1 FL=1|uniref:Thiosulfate reductase n=1 Tax=Thauera phenolivorans TaxID=1792543 RepID=A0A7X7LXN6_9RHOO|nr:cytochrome C oxidase subunit IV family protein [Thauera phenolivorans]NLF55132.1 hypothetical protein [Thauera phenolivorans]
MKPTRKLDLTWLLLVALTLASAALAGRGETELALATAVAAVMALKLRLVCDHFLELREAHPRIRLAISLFCYGMPVLLVLSTAFGPVLARLTSLLVA